MGQKYTYIEHIYTNTNHVLVQQDHGAEGRGNIARCQRRLLLVDVERRLMEFQHYRDTGMVIPAKSEFILFIYVPCFMRLTYFFPSGRAHLNFYW